jgi:hypothetical protein
VAQLVIWAETGYARAQCISTGSMFWVLYVLLGISQFTIQAGYGGIKLVIEKLKNYGKSKSAKTVLDDPDVQSMMGMFFCASYCCAFVCCFLPALIVLLVLVSDSVGIDSTGAAVLLGVAFSAIACTYFSWVSRLAASLRLPPPPAYPAASSFSHMRLPPCVKVSRGSLTRHPRCAAEAQPKNARAQQVPHFHL